MKKNVKIIASLVRKAKRKLNQGKRDEALDLMRKAVNIDDNNGVLVQVIQVIGKKKPLAEPEEEPTKTSKKITEPEQIEQESEQVISIIENNQERKTSMASEDRLIKLFEASDREYNNGHQQKAIAYLKRADKLYPDNPEVLSKLDLLKTKIKSANLVRIAMKKLESGDYAKALVLAREVFDLKPDTEDLDKLLSDIERHPLGGASASTGIGSESSDPNSSEMYISRIRQLVHSNAVVEA